MINDIGEEIDEDLLNSFLEESTIVLTELEIIVTSFNSLSDAKLFESFGQQVDRIMGAAYTLSFNILGDLTKLGKELGYKASQVEDMSKLITIQSILSQLVKSLNEILIKIEKNQKPDFRKYKDLTEKMRRASDNLGDLRVTVKD